MSGWQALDQIIQESCTRIAELAPDPATAAEGEGYIARAAATALASAMLPHTLRQGGLVRALPCWGGPNPHYVMWHAVIDPSRRYMLRGQLRGSERVGVGLYRIGEAG